jgi:SAM-dependent methyltransferase
MIAGEHHTRKSMPAWLEEPFLVSRGVLFIGTRYTCPCCGWRVRGFAHGPRSFRARSLSYCPRCNAKARHRRQWLYLQQRTNLFSDRLRVLDVSPNFGMARRLFKLPNLDYVRADLYPAHNLDIRMDLAVAPLRSDSFDAVICTHVLEHVQEDRKAIREIWRVLRPGGWAIISVPIRLEERTFEDPTITTPSARQRAFGEAAHVRLYGYDLGERLEQGGFQVQLDLGNQVERQTRDRYGLRDDEHLFHCTKV